MKLFIFLLSLGFFLFGCKNFFQLAPVAPVTPPPPVIPPSNGTNPDGNPYVEPSTKYGVVQCNPAEQERFHKNLASFLSSVRSPSAMIPVDCTGNQGIRGGMFMEGQIYFANNQIFNPSSVSQQLQISGGNLTIFIQDTAGNEMKFDYRADLYTSSVRGQSINLTFEENQGIGTVTLSGQDQNGKFEGVLSFNNRIRYDRLATGTQGSLGWFAFETCAILKCR